MMSRYTGTGGILGLENTWQGDINHSRSSLYKGDFERFARQFRQSEQHEQELLALDNASCAGNSDGAGIFQRSAHPAQEENPRGRRVAFLGSAANTRSQSSASGPFLPQSNAGKAIFSGLIVGEVSSRRVSGTSLGRPQPARVPSSVTPCSQRKVATVQSQQKSNTRPSNKRTADVPRHTRHGPSSPKPGQSAKPGPRGRPTSAPGRQGKPSVGSNELPETLSKGVVKAGKPAASEKADGTSNYTIDVPDAEKVKTSQKFAPMKSEVDVVLIRDLSKAQVKCHLGSTGTSISSVPQGHGSGIRSGSGKGRPVRGYNDNKGHGTTMRRRRQPVLNVYEYDLRGHRRHRITVRGRRAARGKPYSRRGEAGVSPRTLRGKTAPAEVITRLWRMVEESRGMRQRFHTSRANHESGGGGGNDGGSGGGGGNDGGSGSGGGSGGGEERAAVQVIPPSDANPASRQQGQVTKKAGLWKAGSQHVQGRAESAARKEEDGKRGRSEVDLVDASKTTDSFDAAMSQSGGAGDLITVQASDDTQESVQQNLETVRGNRIYLSTNPQTKTTMPTLGKLKKAPRRRMSRKMKSSQPNQSRGVLTSSITPRQSGGGMKARDASKYHRRSVSVRPRDKQAGGARKINSSNSSTISRPASAPSAAVGGRRGAATSGTRAGTTTAGNNSGSDSNSKCSFPVGLYATALAECRQAAEKCHRLKYFYLNGGQDNRPLGGKGARPASPTKRQGNVTSNKSGHTNATKLDISPGTNITKEAVVSPRQTKQPACPERARKTNKPGNPAPQSKIQGANTSNSPPKNDDPVTHETSHPGPPELVAQADGLASASESRLHYNRPVNRLSPPLPTPTLLPFADESNSLTSLSLASGSDTISAEYTKPQVPEEATRKTQLVRFGSALTKHFRQSVEFTSHE